jgi:nitrite reductase/ring-hydroxylating ferredoxin subunit
VSEPDDGAFLCFAVDVPDGGAIAVSSGNGSAIVVRYGDALFAYENRCPHFGIPLDVGRGIKTFRRHVLGVNHDAAFRFDDGACVEGPCLGASLTPIPLAIASGRVSRG